MDTDEDQFAYQDRRFWPSEGLLDVLARALAPNMEHREWEALHQ